MAGLAVLIFVVALVVVGIIPRGTEGAAGLVGWVLAIIFGIAAYTGRV